MTLNIDRAFNSIKGDIVFVKSWVQAAMFKQNRDWPFRKRAL